MGFRIIADGYKSNENVNMGGSGFKFAEIAPCVRSIPCVIEGKPKKQKHYFKLSFPYILVGFKYNVYDGMFYFNGLIISFNNRSYEDDTKLALSLLPHTFGSFLLCTNGSSFAISKNLMKEVISSFWSTSFILGGYDGIGTDLEGVQPRFDLAEMGHKKIDSPVGSFEKWQESTFKDPSFILNIEWPVLPCDLDSYSYYGKGKIYTLREAIIEYQNQSGC